MDDQKPRTAPNPQRERALAGPARKPPDWRRALLAAIRQDGRDQWQILAKLSRGEPLVVPDVSDTGQRTGKMRVIRPSAGVILSATRELLDRAFGKPIQTIIAADLTPETGGLLESLSDDDRDILLKMARKRLLGSAEAPDEPIDVTPRSDDTLHSDAGSVETLNSGHPRDCDDGVTPDTLLPDGDERARERESE